MVAAEASDTYIARWRLLAIAVVAIFLGGTTLYSTSKSEDVGLFGEAGLEEGLLDEDGMDHDSKAAIEAARKAAKHINFDLHYDRPYLHKFSEHSCHPSRVRSALHHSLAKSFNFTASVRTNLKVLFLGDFQSTILAEAFQEATGTPAGGNLVLQRYGMAQEPGLHIATTDDYGVVAGYMVNQMPQGVPEEDEAFGALKQKDTKTLLKYPMAWKEELGNFDVVIFKPPQLRGLSSLEEVTWESLKASLEHIANQFGASTILLMTLPMQKQYKTEHDILQLWSTNNLIRSFANDWTPSKNTVLKNVLPVDFAHLTKQAIRKNAHAVNVTTGPSHDFLLERLNSGESKPAIAHVCGAPPEVGGRFDKCKANMLAFDGVYWCMETIGERVVAGVACILKCVVDGLSEECVDACNYQFLSLELIDEDKFPLVP